MAGVLGFADLAKVVSAQVAGSNTLKYLKTWAHTKAERRGLSLSNPAASLYEEIIAKSQFLPGSDLFQATPETSGYLNLAKFGPQTFFVPTTEFVERKVVDVCQKLKWLELQHTVETAVRFLDAAHDSPFRTGVSGGRDIHLGTLGLAELLLRLGIVYGDNTLCQLFLDELYFYIAYWSYKTSVELAKEQGPGLALNSDNSAFVQKLQAGINSRALNYDLVGSIWKHGLRNRVLLAPYSIEDPGFTAETSTGISPFSTFRWIHRGRTGECVEYASVASDYMDQFGVDASATDTLPDYFVSAASVPPAGYAAVYSTVAKWSDTVTSFATYDKVPAPPPLPTDYESVEIEELSQSETHAPLDTLDPSFISGTVTSVKVTDWTATAQADGSHSIILNLTIDLSSDTQRQVVPRATIPAKVPDSYEYTTQRSTLPAPIRKR
jgi:ribonucleotide reductase alpha subunit